MSSAPIPTPTPRLPAALRATIERVWGFRELLALQEPAMAAVLAGRDSLVVLPTGGGKSLCFQAPALLGDGLTVVVSPLISLMKDQVDGLVANGAPAAALHSGLEPGERRRAEEALAAGALKLLYASPERLCAADNGGFLALLERAGTHTFAIDEAHCVSQWGHAFRPEYRELAGLRQVFPNASFHAYTATATERVRRDIVVGLGLVEPELLVGSFDRPNLVYRARRRSELGRHLRALIERHRDEAGIVYCQSRREVERWAERIAGWGFAALPYHAGLDAETRRAHQDAFSEERVQIVVATVAFGMGIDRSNVRFVAHTAAPRSLEHYQQEAGRAGRDGLAADCVLFYSPGDFAVWRRLLEQSGELDEAARRLLAGMSRYAAATSCRHRALVEYFGERWEKASCDACDWCLGELERLEDARVVAQKILSCVLRLEERWGMGQLVDVLRGRSTEKVRANRHQELSTFGLFEDVPVGELRSLVEQLVDAGHLVIEGDRFPTLAVTGAGRELLRGEREVALFRQPRPAPRRRRTASPAGEEWEGVDPGLFERLRELRLELARERGVPPYVIFHDTTLRELARRRPASPAELREVYGVGEKKAAELGPVFLEAIAAWTREGGGGEAPPGARPAGPAPSLFEP